MLTRVRSFSNKNFHVFSFYNSLWQWLIPINTFELLGASFDIIKRKGRFRLFWISMKDIQMKKMSVVSVWICGKKTTCERRESIHNGDTRIEVTNTTCALQLVVSAFFLPIVLSVHCISTSTLLGKIKS